jgi:hypothetical protein
VLELRQGPFVLPSFTLALRITADGMARFLAPEPVPGWHDLLALRRQGALSIEGDTALFFAHLLWFKGFFDLLRAAPLLPAAAPPPPVGTPVFESLLGRYLRLDIEGRPHRVYVEEAGEGPPLLLLHTAGSDGRQWRDLLNDADLTARFRCIAFDMPWHGKSSPPVGWEREEYRLTTARYTGLVMTMARALGLDRPIVMGCSIGGRIVLDRAIGHTHGNGLDPVPNPGSTGPLEGAGVAAVDGDQRGGIGDQPVESGRHDPAPGRTRPNRALRLPPSTNDRSAGSGMARAILMRSRSMWLPGQSVPMTSLCGPSLS